jgi:hypothetical protein
MALSLDPAVRPACKVVWDRRTTLSLFDCRTSREAIMGLDPLDMITEGCWLALRFGLHVSAMPTENLLLAGGAYRLGVGKTYHPLETLLVGVVATGDWRKDVATTLGVHVPWVIGFLDGFGQRPKSSTDAEYVQGYLTAEELRIARYRRDLPDRG